MSEDFPHFCRAALDMGVLVTPGAVPYLIAVPYNIRPRLAAKLAEATSTLRYEGSELLRSLEPELSEFLSPESLGQLRSSISEVLRSVMAGLDLRDVRPEVLMTWLAEIQSQASSSVQDGENGKEVTTPSRAETVATSGDAALQPGTHGTGEGI
ncbi:MAG: hypothetical protein ABF826_08195 [Komagataeibacter saccharivorans]|uniref:hypothetical protein n=1 Tax=Komagataeibacter saccharivorans TaxID=265959 RepID=UPI0013C2FC61|nr:hypothetical protein [Komagataeibacter saccharivorans]